MVFENLLFEMCVVCVTDGRVGTKLVVRRFDDTSFVAYTPHLGVRLCLHTEFARHLSNAVRHTCHTSVRVVDA